MQAQAQPDTTPDVADFVRDHGITATFKPGSARDDMDPDWAANAVHFDVTLTCDGRKLTVPWSCGRGWAADFLQTFGRSWGTGPQAREVAAMRGRDRQFSAEISRRLTREHGFVSVDAASAADRLLAIFAKVGPGPDKAADVLDCLKSDAQSSDQPFEDWAADLGYDSDSRRAERIWHTCNDIRRKLYAWLGRERADALLWDTEGL